MDLVYSEGERKKNKGEKKKLPLTSVTQMATDKYHILVSKNSTLSTLKSRESKMILMQGRKGEVSDEELDDVAEALVSYIAVSHINGDAKLFRKATLPFRGKADGRTISSIEWPFLLGMVQEVDQEWWYKQAIVGTPTVGALIGSGWDVVILLSKITVSVDPMY
eukprot:scaffold108717_cov59-Attheya_sp.AAC.1